MIPHWLDRNHAQNFINWLSSDPFYVLFYISDIISYLLDTINQIKMLDIAVNTKYNNTLFKENVTFIENFNVYN